MTRLSDTAADAPERPLVALVEASCEARCRQTRLEAKARADALLRQAWREARTRLRKAVTEERAYRRQAEEAALAERDTLVRQRRLAQEQRLLAQGRLLLEQSLLTRWGQPAPRAAWIALLLAEGMRRLGGGDWTLRHPIGWDRGELAPHLEALTAHNVTLAQCEADPTLAAGLVLVRAGARLDGSLAGLTADRAAIDALLLAELGRTEAPTGNDADAR